MIYVSAILIYIRFYENKQEISGFYLRYCTMQKR